jgi:hypothetical protein
MAKRSAGPPLRVRRSDANVFTIPQGAYNRPFANVAEWPAPPPHGGSARGRVQGFAGLW